MAWREIIGIVMFISGLSAPSVGKMLGHDFRVAAVILCVIGVLAFYSERVYRRRRFGEPSVGGLNEADVLDSALRDHGGNGGDVGGHGGEGDH